MEPPPNEATIPQSPLQAAVIFVKRNPHFAKTFPNQSPTNRGEGPWSCIRGIYDSPSLRFSKLNTKRSFSLIFAFLTTVGDIVDMPDSLEILENTIFLS